MSRRTGMDEEKDVITFKDKIHCKNCRFFTRVSEKGNQTQLRGFCLKGMNEGSFDLYLSASYASDCPSFFYNEENARITDVENQLNQIKDQYFREGERDAKRILRKQPELKMKHNPFQTMFMGHQIGWERFVADKHDALAKLSDMAHLTKRNYSTLLNFIQTKTFQFVIAHTKRDE